MFVPILGTWHTQILFMSELNSQQVTKNKEFKIRNKKPIKAQRYSYILQNERTKWQHI